MEKEITATNSVVCKNNDHIFNYYGWPTVGRLPDGTLAVVASGHRLEHVCPFGKAMICYSRDEGKTWSEPSAVIDTPLDDRDGGIAVFGNGNVMVTSFNNSVAAQRAWLQGYLAGSSGNRARENKARLWGVYLDAIEGDAPVIEAKYLGSTFKISKDGGYTFGDFMRSPVTSPHGPANMRDGNLLHIGNEFNIEDQQPGSRGMSCYKVSESGEYEYLSSIEWVDNIDGKPLDENCEPHALVLPDGKIIVHIRMEGGGNFTVFQSESYDGGRTFTKPHPIGLAHGSPAHLLVHSSGVLISSYGYRREPFGQRVMFSRDSGETWDVDYILRKDGNSGDLGYPATVELKDGSLLTVYYQAEKGRDNCVIMQSIWKLPINTR